MPKTKKFEEDDENNFEATSESSNDPLDPENNEP